MLRSRLFSLRSFVVAMKPAVKKTAEVGCLVRSVGMVRSLSGSVPSKCASVQRDLISALQEEINEEKKMAMEHIDGSSAVAGFDVSTKGAEVRLHKKHGNNESIDVVFNVNHSLNVEYEDEAVDDEVAEDEVSENIQMPKSTPQLSVQVTKGDQRLCFELEIISRKNDEHDFQVREFYLAPADKSGQQDVEADVYAASGEFADQIINELLFGRYLGERGIDGEFCDQLVKFATYYEHSQYIDLLDKVKNFISKKA